MTKVGDVYELEWDDLEPMDIPESVGDLMDEATHAKLLTVFLKDTYGI